MIDYKSYWDRGMTYAQYRELVDGLIEEGKSTGPEQSASLLDYSKLNQQRMRRLEKTVKVEGQPSLDHKGLRVKHVLVITEGWCGDAAQIVPVIEKFTNQNGIKAKYLLRDSNLELMDAHLINGGRSIPVLLFLTDDINVLAQWGPRPKPLQDMVMNYKKRPEPKRPYSEFSKEVQLWYAKDKQQTMMKEWGHILKA